MSRQRTTSTETSPAATAVGMGAPTRFQFDEILVAPKDSQFRPVRPPTLSFERKYVYAGDNGNWRLNFKDLNALERSTIERDVYDDDDGGGGSSGRRRTSRSGDPGRNSGGGRASSSRSSETLVLSLSGKKLSLKCTARKGSTARAARDLESFLEGLKCAHRRAKARNNEKDPYAASEEKRRRSLGGSTSAGRASSNGVYGRQRGQRVTQVTPASYGRSVLLSPQKKRNAGSFRSPERRRRGSSAARTPESEAEGERGNTVGNVVRQVALSPAARRLNLPPKSPRNATPVKKRRSSSGGGGGEEDAGGGGKRKSRCLANQLNGISGGNIELRERLDREHANNDDEHADLGKEDDGEEPAGLRKRREHDFEEEEAASGEEEEKKECEEMPKRRRLQKRAGEAEEGEDNDSDVEFEDDREASHSSCKKKLRLSFREDDDDDQEEEAVGSSRKESKKEEAVSMEEVTSEKEIASKKEAPDEEAASASGSLSSNQSQQNAESERVETASPQSAADAALAPSPAKKAPARKGSLPGFFPLFAPSASKRKGVVKGSAAKKRPSPQSRDSTYVASLSTPPKRVCPGDDGGGELSATAEKSSALPATPSSSRRADLSVPTPVTKTVQRKDASRYFSSKPAGDDDSGDGEGGGDSPPDNGAVDVWDAIHSCSNRNGWDATTDYGAPPKAAARQQQQPRRQYGRTAGSMLGQPRLVGSSISVSRPPIVRRGDDRKSPVSRLDFGPRGAPSTADVALGSGPLGSKSRALSPVTADGNNSNKAQSPKPSVAPNVRGIRNLGNTCYLAASLQALFAVPRFVSDLRATYERRSSPDRERMPLTRALLEASSAVDGAPNGEGDAAVSSPAPADAKGGGGAARPTPGVGRAAADPGALKRRMDSLTDKFAGYEQRDAHEFLSDLVDFLHDELAGTTTTGGTGTTAKEAEGAGAAKPTTDADEEAGRSKEGEGENGASSSSSSAAAAGEQRGALPTDEYFHLNVRVRLECDSCGYSRSKDEMYRHLSLDVGEDSVLNKCTVERGLRQFFQPERRELKCEKCAAGRTATQTMEITSCPKALLLHFKRFIVTQEMKGAVGVTSDGKGDKAKTPPPRMEMVLRKNKAKITLEESLSINSFVGENEKRPPGRYRLRGVVHHVGSTASSGHYTTCAKRRVPPTPDPRRFGGDDDRETRRTEEANEGVPLPGDNSIDDEEQWIFFDDRVGVRKDAEYVTGHERNQRNCYMALYELKS